MTGKNAVAPLRAAVGQLKLYLIALDVMGVIVLMFALFYAMAVCCIYRKTRKRSGARPQSEVYEMTRRGGGLRRGR